MIGAGEMPSLSFPQRKFRPTVDAQVLPNSDDTTKTPENQVFSQETGGKKSIFPKVSRLGDNVPVVFENEISCY
jgi:hypothetical protein